MKNLPKMAFCVIFLLFSLNSTQAQNDSTKIRKNVISTHPILLITLSPSISYERIVSPKTSVSVGFSYGTSKLINLRSDLQVNLFTAIIGYRYYIQKDNIAPRGFYLSPTVRYQDFLIATGDTYERKSLFGGLASGYQWVFGSNFTFDIYIGIQGTLYQRVIKEQNQEGFPNSSLFTGLRLGYNF